jgi:hypothetical protein
VNYRLNTHRSFITVEFVDRAKGLGFKITILASSIEFNVVVLFDSLGQIYIYKRLRKTGRFRLFLILRI